MQTYPTPSGFGYRECSDGPVSVPFCSLDLQPLWLPRGEMLGTPSRGHRAQDPRWSPTIRAQSSQELVQLGALALGPSGPAEVTTRASEASPKLPHLPPRPQQPAPGRYLGPRLGSTPNRRRRVAPGAARSGSGCGSQAASRGPPPAPAMEPLSGDDPARHLPHPQCSLWAGRAAPSWRGERGGVSGHTTSGDRRDDAPEPNGPPRLTACNGPVGQYQRCQGEGLGGASGHAPSVNSPQDVRNGWGGPHHPERGKQGTGNLDTPPQRRGNPRS